MPATPAWFAAIEGVLNRNVHESAAAAAAARRLEGKTLEIDAEGLLSVRVTAVGGRLALAAARAHGAPAPPADAAISGSPAALMQLLLSRSGRPGTDGPGERRDGAWRGRPELRRPLRPAAQVRGDAEAASLFRELFALSRPDLEEEVSRWIGDLPARRLLRAARGAFAWLRRTGRTAGENAAEYLQEESRALVNATELQEFLHAVDQVRETVDRVEARLARLERRAPAVR